MEQRPLRVGDNVDDYCPRERRITNHVIVALVGTAIRQTRCAACETEHVFKAGQPPRHRKKEEPAGILVPSSNGSHGSHAHESANEAPATLSANGHDEPNRSESSPTPPEQPAPGNELWSGHRPLIRATLPKVEGNEPPPRAIPEFTMHQRNVRGAHAFRQGQPWHDRPSDTMRGGRHGSSFGSGNGGGHGGGRGANFGGSGHGNGNGNGSDNIGNGAGPGGPGPGNQRPGGGGRRRRRRGPRKPGGPI